MASVAEQAVRVSLSCRSIRVAGISVFAAVTFTSSHISFEGGHILGEEFHPPPFQFQNMPLSAPFQKANRTAATQLPVYR